MKMAETNDERDIGYRAYWAGDYAEAHRLLLPFAERGDAEVQCAVATLYHLGFGIPPDCLIAEHWYLKSGLLG
jgi:TPR repeat protein